MMIGGACSLLAMAAGTEPKSSFANCLREIGRQLLVDREYIVLTAGALDSAPEMPDGLSLVRIASLADPRVPLAVTAMEAVEEPEVVPERLGCGDEFWGWEENGRVRCFAWVSHRNRLIGMPRVRDLPERVFLYNVFTLPECRGLGLQPALQQQIRFLMGQEGRTEFVLQVKTCNAPSLKAVTKSGFEPVVRTTIRTFLQRFRWEHDCDILHPSGKPFDGEA